MKVKPQKMFQVFHHETSGYDFTLINYIFPIILWYYTPNMTSFSQYYDFIFVKLSLFFGFNDSCKIILSQYFASSFSYQVFLFSNVALIRLCIFDKFVNINIFITFVFVIICEFFCSYFPGSDWCECGPQTKLV